MPEKVIVNTSPIFYLHRLGLLELLKKIYGIVTVPRAVVGELEEGRVRGADVPDLSAVPWVKIQDVRISQYIRLIPDLGPGEAEVLTLGLEEPDSLMVIDDLLARRIAELQGLKFTGTAGVIIKARLEGYIPCVSDVITQLDNLGFRLTQALKEDILRLAGEKKT